MRRPLRLALVVVGLAVAVYGVASLTGGWLGTPPWWEVEETHSMPLASAPQAEIEALRRDPTTVSIEVFQVRQVPRPGREWISGAVVALGLGFLALGVWPRGRRVATS